MGRRGLPALGARPPLWLLAPARSGVSSCSQADGGPARDGGGWRLPRGPHGLPREVVTDHQRQRLLAATAAALAEHGYAELTVEHVLKLAGVSRTTFYENFDNKRECVLVAHEQAFDRLSGELLRACASHLEWPAKVKAAIATVIAYAAGSPHEARLLILDSVAADPALVSRVTASNDVFIGLLRGGRERCPRAAELPELTERAMIGAVTSVIGARLLAGGADQLAEVEAPLVEFLLLPYLGAEDARRMAGSS